jgi:hypothetical protein
MVFSARLVDWKLGSEPMASYYQMNDLPKKLQSKIKIDFNMENLSSEISIKVSYFTEILL